MGPTDLSQKRKKKLGAPLNTLRGFPPPPHKEKERPLPNSKMLKEGARPSFSGARRKKGGRTSSDERK